MKTLELERLVELHTLVIMRTGGSDGLRDLGRLEVAIAVQSQVVFGEELYSTLFEKAAALIRGIVGDHPFVDGNKRTAMLAGLTLLDINGKRFQAKTGELEDFAVRIVVDHFDVPTIVAWLKAHCS